MSYIKYVVVHVVVQTGNALPRQKLLDVTTRIDRVLFTFHSLPVASASDC